MSHLVAISRCPRSESYPYPDFPYGPGESYPEHPTLKVGAPNAVYAAVRQCFYLLGLDREHFGTAMWNPLKDVIQPGQRVLIKPNLVKHCNASGSDLYAVITHPSVVRAVMDYALLAMKGQGQLILGDAPLQSADFDVLMEETRLREVPEHLDSRGVNVEIRDFRQTICRKDARGHVVAHEERNGDPAGYATVNVGNDSFLCEVEQFAKRFRVTNYDPRAMLAHHSLQHHEYLIAKTVLLSDVVINIPKMKTHRKAGVSCCLKNVVGINGSKDYLPHHRAGALSEGGDEYQRPCFWKRIGSGLYDFIEADPGRRFHGLARAGLRLTRRMAHREDDPFQEGSWYGNDTIWRTVMDLNYILRFAQADGTLSDKPQRKLFHIVDGIIAGGGEGPLRPTAVRTGWILAGRSRTALDLCAARLAGFDPQKIPLLRNAWNALCNSSKRDSDIQLISEEASNPGVSWNQIMPEVVMTPPADWAGHIELEREGTLLQR